MADIDELVFLHQMTTPCHLAILAESIGFKTRVVSKVEQLETDNKSGFFLIAQQKAALNNDGIPLVAVKLVQHVPVALYCVERDSLDPESALMLGIRGILFSDQRMDLLLTALRKMIADELWYERPLLSKVYRHLIERSDPAAGLSPQSVAALHLLTTREKTIIQLVASGARNKEIAERLCISEHTVKAHLSSVYRKTESRNRVELLRWAQTFQSHF